MQLSDSWCLLLLVGLSALYGYTQCLALAAMGASARQVRHNRLAAALSSAVLTVSWSVWGYPLPVFYAAAYLLRAARLVGGGRRKTSLLLLNLSYINTMALHLFLIGAAALTRGVTMHALLDSGSWRAMSTAAVLAATLVEDLTLLRLPGLPAVLAAEAESLEARPFMAFLWFCTGYLLVDSFLCVVELEPIYPPLFLMGSITILMYMILRFLLHINTILRDEHVKDENQRLSARLEAAQETAGTLKRLVDQDALTGVYSRRHILERMAALIGEDAPFSLAFMDLDGLKGINDRGGHDAGDRYLIGFTQAMASRLREEDLLARLGGDEFLVLMPGCGAVAARRRIEDIRRTLEGRGPGGMPFRFSCGFAESLPGDRRDPETLVREADRAMYQDKGQRR